MKKFTMKFVTTCFMLLCFVFHMSANDIYISSEGNDDNDGLSSAKAVKTLTKAMALISSAPENSVIKVMGVVNISGEVSNNDGILINGSIKFTVEGISKETSGFDGGNFTRIFNFQGFTGSATLKNLTFSNGASTEGGAIKILNSANANVLIENCDFFNNTSSSTGTLHIYNSNVTINDSEFTNNSAKLGGGIYAASKATVTINSCLITDNDISTIGGSSGGGIYAKETNGIYITNSIIRNNKSNAQGGGLTILNTPNEDDIVSITNTLIAYNESTNNSGGGIFINDSGINNKIQIIIANSTIYSNMSKSYGGAIFYSGGQTGSTITLVNNTIVENKTQGNGGHGPGLNFRDCSNITRKIYNCIIEDNFAPNSSAYGDIASNFDYNTGIEDNFILRNSYVGQFTGSGYTDQPSYNNTIKYGNKQSAGLAKPSADYITKQNSIPLDFDSDGLKKGSAQYLQALGINIDQLGVIRSFKNDICAVGAVETPAEFVITEPDPHDYQHFFIYGQSLSVGQESFYPISIENVEGNYMIGEQMWINLGNKNLDKLNPLVASRTISYNKTCENPLISAVNHIRIRQEQDFPQIENRFIATSCGTGAQPIETLSKGSERGLYENDFLAAVKQAKKITAKTGSTISSPAIFWMQGENNYNKEGQKLSKEEYKKALVKLKNDMQTDIAEIYQQQDKPIFFTYQTGGGWTNGDRALHIGMAQLEASNQYDDIICVGPTYHLSYSNNHLCSNGSRWYGEYMAKVYYKTQVLGEKFKPLQPKVLCRDLQDSKKVIIQFHVPEPPLVFDTSILEKRHNYGFSVYMDNSKQTITDVQIVGDCVEITCANDLIGNLDVLYGEKNTINGTGNLRDSDSYQALSNYMDADAKDGSGNYIYPRIEDYESLRPITPEPKDEDGNIIYNKPYPLYNFGVAFTYPLLQGVNEYKVPYINDDGSGIADADMENNSIRITQTGKKIQISASGAHSINISIYSISGHKTRSFRQTQLTKEYDLSVLPSGIYVVKVSDSKKSKVVKVKF